MLHPVLHLTILYSVVCSVRADNHDKSVDRQPTYTNNGIACPNDVFRQNLKRMEKSLEQKMMMFSSYTQSRKNGDDLRLMMMDTQGKVKELQTEMVYLEKRMRIFGEEQTNRILSTMGNMERRGDESLAPYRVDPRRDNRVRTRPDPRQIQRDTEECSDGYIPIGQKCVKFYAQKRPYYGAQSLCRAEGGHLLYIKTYDEMDFVTSLLIYNLQVATKYRDGIWIGLRGTNTPSRWMWTNGDELGSDWSYWETGQPDGQYRDDAGKEQTAIRKCVYMALNVSARMKWSDTSCDVALPFVCEKPLLTV